MSETFYKRLVKKFQVFFLKKRSLITLTEVYFYFNAWL